MSSLVERLHPSGWNDEFFSGALRLAVVVFFGFAVAAVLGPLLLAWLRRRLPEHDGEARRAVRTLRAAVVLLGIYVGAEALPISHRAMDFVEGVLFVLVVVLLARAATRGALLGLRAYVERRAEGPERARAQAEYLPLASVAVTFALGLMALSLIAHHYNHDVSSMVAALGVGSLAIGLAAQQTLGNVSIIAGFLLLVDHPFRPGDHVRLQSGESGTIDHIGIRATRIVLAEGNLLVVPNAEMANTRVVNLSQPADRTRTEVRCKVPWALSALAQEALLEAAAAEPELGQGGAPVVRVVSIEQEVVEVAVQFDVPPSVRAAVEDRVRAAALVTLAAAREHKA